MNRHNIYKFCRLVNSGRLIRFAKHRLGFYRKAPVLTYDPQDLIINATNLCNLRCKMCPHGDPKLFHQKTTEKYNRMYIPLDYVKKCLVRFPGITNVQVAGIGEPFLHPRMFSLLHAIDRQRRIVSIVTNGTLLNHKKVDRLLSLKYLDYIQFSLNAHDAKSYREITGGKERLFYKVISNIEYMARHRKKKGVKIVLSNVMAQEMFPRVSLFIDLAISLGVDAVNLQQYISDHPSVGAYSCYKSPLTPPTNDQLRDIINEIKIKYGNKIEISLPKIRTANKFSKKCSSFFKTLHVNADGYIGSCGRDMLPEKEFGHIEDDEVWNNDYMIKNRLLFLDDHKMLHECCLDCPSNF